MCDLYARKRLEDFLVHTELPQYNDLEQVLSSLDTCLFCRAKDASSLTIHNPDLNVSYNICEDCQSYWIDISAGAEDKMDFCPISSSEIVKTYFKYRVGDTRYGWAYEVHYPQNRLEILFGEHGNEVLFNRRELAIVAGINHIFDLNTLNSRILNDGLDE